MLLQACPDCGRQYDVRHLEPGGRVRCACEHEFRVEHVRDLRVAARRCANCGGPVGAEHAACPYCGAALDALERSSMPCPACFARIAEDARHCSTCGTTIHPQSLPPIPSGRSCPRCKGRLQIRVLPTFALVECERCRGIWIDPEAFRATCREAEQASFELPDDRAPAKTPRAGGPHYIPCLDCGELMVRRQHRHRDRPTGVVLDVCREHGVWLDGRELESLLASIQRLGSQPESLRPRNADRAFDLVLAEFDRAPLSGSLIERVLATLGAAIRLL